MNLFSVHLSVSHVTLEAAVCQSVERYCIGYTSCYAIEVFIIHVVCANQSWSGGYQKLEP